MRVVERLARGALAGNSWRWFMPEPRSLPLDSRADARSRVVSASKPPGYLSELLVSSVRPGLTAIEDRRVYGTTELAGLRMRGPCHILLASI